MPRVFTVPGIVRTPVMPSIVENRLSVSSTNFSRGKIVMIAVSGFIALSILVSYVIWWFPSATQTPIAKYANHSHSSALDFNTLNVGTLPAQNLSPEPVSLQEQKDAKRPLEAPDNHGVWAQIRAGEILGSKRKFYFTLAAIGLLVAGLIVAVTLITLHLRAQEPIPLDITKPDQKEITLKDNGTAKGEDEVNPVISEMGWLEAFNGLPLHSRICFGAAITLCGLSLFSFVIGLETLNIGQMMFGPYHYVSPTTTFRSLKAPYNYLVFVFFAAAAIAHVLGIYFLGALSNLALSLIFSSVWFALGFALWTYVGIFNLNHDAAVQESRKTSNEAPLPTPFRYNLAPFTAAFFMGACGAIGGSIGHAGSWFIFVPFFLTLCSFSSLFLSRICCCCCSDPSEEKDKSPSGLTIGVLVSASFLFAICSKVAVYSFPFNGIVPFVLAALGWAPMLYLIRRIGAMRISSDVTANV